MIRTAVIAATAALAIAAPGPRRNRGELPREPPAPLGRHRRGRDAQGQRVAHRVGGHGPSGRRPLAGLRPPAGRAHHDDLPRPPRRRLAERLRARARHPCGRGDREEPAQLRRPQPRDRPAQPGRRGRRHRRSQNSTYWGVLALRAAGVPAPRGSLAVIRGAQRSNGGYSWSASAGPGRRRHLGRRHGAAGGRRVVQQPRRLAGVRLPGDRPVLVARLRAPARELREQPVDVMGGPGPPPLQPAATARRWHGSTRASSRRGPTTTSRA